MRRKEYSSEEVTIRSFGGTGGYVTGSCHRVDTPDCHMLVDCGLFQGRESELQQADEVNQIKRGTHMNMRPVDDIMKDVGDIAATHSHVDHIGELPFLFRKGYSPKIWATFVTARFMGAMLHDSAKIQQGEGGEHLYTDDDVYAVMRAVGRGVKPFSEITLNQGQVRNNTIRFELNGHVPGSAAVLYQNHSTNDTILFTGDIGRPEQPLSGGYLEYAHRYSQVPIKTLVTESTSFDRNPVSFEDAENAFFAAINASWANKGNPLLPVLSFDRFQQLMLIIKVGQETGRIPPDVEIIIDSPLGKELLKEYQKLTLTHLSRRYGDNPNFFDTIDKSQDRFGVHNVRFIESHQSSEAADKEYAHCFPKKVIVIAGGGMLGHGRVVNYYNKHEDSGFFGDNPRNSVILSCFQVPGTEGAEALQLNEAGNKSGRANIIRIEGFTSHATGPDQVFGFLERFNLSELDTVIIGHGRDRAREAMAKEFKRRGYRANIILSRIGQVIKVA